MTGVRESEIDGVLCFWVDMGRPASCAHLLFRQGLADEPLHESGWLHLLEHLALLDRETLTRPIEGRLSILRTHFAAFGGPEAVAQHITALARWLAEPDLRLLPRERGLLQAQAYEARDRLARSLTWRYGAQGPGVASYPELGAMRATEELLTARSRRVFNASNAILVLDGPPPEGLSLPLPRGEFFPARPAEPMNRRVPAAYRDEVGLTISGAVSRTHGASFLAQVLERSLHDGLRHHSGSALGLWSSAAEVDNRQLVVAAGSEVVDEMLPSLARAAMDVTAQLAERGVPRDWIQEAVDRRLRVLESPAAEVETALEAAYAALSDQVPMTYAELLEQLRNTDPRGVDQAARELHDTLLVGLPEAAPLSRTIPAVSFPDQKSQGTGTKHSHVNWPADLTTFSIDGVVAERVTGGIVHAIRLDQVVSVLAYRDGARHLIGRDGNVVEMDPREWMRGKDLTKAIDSALPSELQLAMPDRPVTFKQMSVTDRSARTFARVANTRVGLVSLLAVVVLLGLWGMVAGHRIVGVVLLILAAAVGAQLWRTEAGEASGMTPPPTSTA